MESTLLIEEQSMSREELIKEKIEKDKSGDTDLFGLPDQGFELTDEQLSSITGGDDDEKTKVCPHCGSTNIIPFYSPTKGTSYLCVDCYQSFQKKK